MFAAVLCLLFERKYALFPSFVYLHIHKISLHCKILTPFYAAFQHGLHIFALKTS